MSLATQQVAAVYGHSSIEQNGVGYVSFESVFTALSCRWVSDHITHGWSWNEYIWAVVIEMGCSGCLCESVIVAR